MVMIKPHTITVSKILQAQMANGVLENPTPAVASEAIRCLCFPLTPSEAYAWYGATLINPWKVILEVSDAVASCAPNAEIVLNGMQFWQKGDAQILSNGDPADCAVLLIAENQFPLES